jgi:hypothetical protein
VPEQYEHDQAERDAQRRVPAQQEHRPRVRGDRG